MKVDIKKKSDVDIFELEGELDFHTSPDFRQKIQGVLQASSKKILVNLKKVPYIDSSGLATFVEALQKAKRNSSKLVLSELHPAVRSVFEIAKLDKVFTLAENEEEALRALGIAG
ncbi:MAG: STAS domain-containing protein [Candidatus Omnitrophota bacterium]